MWEALPNTTFHGGKLGKRHRILANIAGKMNRKKKTLFGSVPTGDQKMRVVVVTVESLVRLTKGRIVYRER